MTKYIIKVNGNPYEVEVEEVGGAKANSAVATKTVTRTMSKTATPAHSVKKAQPGSAGDVAAPMPGTVLKVKVSLEDEVKKGQVLLILEAMKMENEIVSPADGKVTFLNVEAGKSVTAGEVMVTIA